MHVPKAMLAALFLVGAVACLDADSSTDVEAFAVANPDGTIVCHKNREIAVNFHSVPAHLAHGDFLGPCEPEATAATSSVLVCHLTGAEPGEIEVAFASLPAHLAHGDFLGPCTGE
jgi:hypothetical protein